MLELLKEEPELLFNVIEQYFESSPSEDEKEVRSKKMMEVINRNYDKYDDVFKALA